MTHAYGNSTAFQIDCKDLTKRFDDGYFDLAVVDIPYGIGADKPSKKTASVKQKNGSRLNVKLNDYRKKDWDVLPDQEYFDELFRVSKNQIIFGANYAGLKGGYIVWDKLNGATDQYGCELAYQSFSNRTDMVYFMWSGMMQGTYCGTDVRKALVQQGNKALNEKRIHPTQKPVALYDWIFHNYSSAGQKVLDTHLGSQSSRIAAWKHGLDFTGCELDEEYFEEGCDRFDQFRKQLTLF
jgi:site-specific DNA-methyltransferase (adenine-specific)